MMRRLFQTFERRGLEYLLISGQASILYGAATVSEDIDIWIAPSPTNVERLIGSLNTVGARIHKLTPPLTQRYLRTGHGFHFIIPARPLPLYLDVLGYPPRVGSFQDASRRRRRILTEWGPIPVVSIEDLVELKKTRRLHDYEVISNLVRIRIQSETKPSRSLLRWATRNSFHPEERRAFLRSLGVSKSLTWCRRQVLTEVDRLQSRDTAYWSKIVRQLKVLRRLGKLLPEGQPVAGNLAR